MKFVARKQAPNIPLEVIEAQENDSLVIFCGSGISVKAGLPTFRTLVDRVYKQLAQTKTHLEQAAYKDSLYDRVLGLLETRLEDGNQTGVNILRKAILDELELDEDPDLSTHKAILDLSRTSKGQFRLVTTNVDHGFEEADEGVNSQSDAAPKLPVAKAHKWESVVYLHGLIDKQHDSNGQHIVFTSGDFGAAYLTERWASRFVTDLFTNFTVLFVGYSVSDPVIRYITDAIAAENRAGSIEKYKKPFVIAHTRPKDRRKSFDQWDAMGIAPILYSNQGAPYHANFHNTMVAWAEYVRDGLNAKERIIRENAVIPPLPPYDFNETIPRVVETLKESANIQNDGVTGTAARIFARLDDPVAPLEWLPILEKEGLLSIAEKKDYARVAGKYVVYENLVQPNVITLEIWRWLLHHLEDIRLVDWVIERGPCLHPTFKRMLISYISSSPPMAPYFNFWSVVAHGRLECDIGRLDGRAIRHLGNGSPDVGSFMMLDRFLVPFYKINKSTFFPREGSNERLVDDKPFRAKVSIGLDRHMLDRTRDNSEYPRAYISELLNVTNHLKQALAMQTLVDGTSSGDDRSHWDLPSVSDHDQNRFHERWVTLIVLCRDIWESQYQIDRESSLTTLDLWKNIPYVTFRRLVLHAYTKPDIAPLADVVKYLLEDEGRWLWSPVTRREVFRLLNSIWKGLEAELSDEILQYIAIGPPRDMFVSDIDDETYQDIIERGQFRFYSKLELFGRTVEGSHKESFDFIKRKHPKWELGISDSDEFSHYMYSNDEILSEETSGRVDLSELDSSSRVGFISSKEESFGSRRRETYTEFCKENSEFAIDDINYAAENEIWEAEFWRSAVFGLSESDTRGWKQLLSVLMQVPATLVSDISWSISWLLRKATKDIELDTQEEELFWGVAEKLIEYAPDIPADQRSNRDVINQAINNEVGIFIDALIGLLDKRKIKAGDGISEPQPKLILNQIMNSGHYSASLGKVLLCSRMLYFYSIDPDWTKLCLIPLLDFEVEPQAALYWEGVARSPRYSIDLAVELKQQILKVFENSGEFEKFPRSLVSLFISITLGYPNLFSRQEQQQVFRSLSLSSLEDSALLLFRAVKDEQEGSNDYWHNRVKPFLLKVWPKGGSYQSPTISKYFSLLLIELGEEFSDGLEVLGDVITPIGDSSQPLRSLLDTQIIELFTEDAFSLFMKVFSEENGQNVDLLEESLARFSGVDASYETNPDYLRMQRLIRGNLLK